MKLNKYFCAVLFLSLIGGQVAECRSIRFLFFKAPADAASETVMYVNQGAPREVPLPRNNFNKKMELEDGELTLHFLPAVLDASEEFPDEAPAVKVPEMWDDILILVSHDPANTTLPMAFQAVDASDNNLRAGDTLFMNFTDSSIFGTVGLKELKLGAHESAIMRNVTKGNEDYQVELDRFDPKTKKTKILVRQVWRQSVVSKSLLFIYSPPGSVRVSYYCAPVRDY